MICDRTVTPNVSWGVCKMRKHKPVVITYLANGYCVTCWDKGHPRRRKKEAVIPNE